MYLVASLIPALSAASGLANPYPEYGIWLWVALLAVCLGQFLRPCFFGAAFVACSYAWHALEVIQREIGAFEDFGSEDHSRWEGWGWETIYLAYAAFVVLLAVATALHAWKMATDAT